MVGGFPGALVTSDGGLFDVDKRVQRVLDLAIRQPGHLDDVLQRGRLILDDGLRDCASEATSPTPLTANFQ